MLKSGGRTVTVILMPVLLLSIGCTDDEAPPVQEKISSYFALKNGNSWTYQIEYFNQFGEWTPGSKEKWKVNPDLFIDIYEITANGEIHQGYKALYPHNDQEVKDIIGTYVSIKYIDLPEDTMVLVASDFFDFLRERKIKGGKVQLDTNFGKLDCICTKTSIHFEFPVTVYEYFCKDVGICLVEYRNMDGVLDTRKILTDYKLYWNRSLGFRKQTMKKGLDIVNIQPFLLAYCHQFFKLTKSEAL